MYRLLVVDDERIARESVQSLLAIQPDMELEILLADSAPKAVGILETEQVDIVIMDINMPQMTGLELYDVVRNSWPHCKVIFLTGYSEFDYVYKVHKHARYVLKADRDEVLVEAVRESIREIEKDMLLARAEEMDPGFKERAGTFRAREFMTELLDGYTGLSVVDNGVLRDMNVPVDLRKPLYALLVRCRELGKTDFSRRQIICEQLMLLLEKYFLHGTKAVIVPYHRTDYYLLLQPEGGQTEQTAVRRLCGQCSLFQTALQMNSGADAAILVPDRAMSFREAVNAFRLFRNAIHTVRSGDTQTLALEPENPMAAASAGLAEQAKAEIANRVRAFGRDLDAGNRQGALDILHRLRELTAKTGNGMDLFLPEQIVTLGGQLLKAARGLEPYGEPGLHSAILGLFDLPAYQNWDAAFARLEDVAEQVFELRERRNTGQEENLVERIKSYIQRHLDNDTSLTGLAEHFHFSREYLLRVFKKAEGVTILQYINDLKIQRARELLRNPDLPVKEIAAMLGFASTGYFIRFFKSKENQSPQAYREGRREE